MPDPDLEITRGGTKVSLVWSKNKGGEAPRAEVIDFQKSPSSDFICAGYTKGDALQWLLYDIV